MERLLRWLEEQKPNHAPKSPMGKAIRYALGNWQALTRFLGDANIDPDNNKAEGALRRTLTPAAASRRAPSRWEAAARARKSRLTRSNGATRRRSSGRGDRGAGTWAHMSHRACKARGLQGAALGAVASSWSTSSTPPRKDLRHE